jgi:hypothetical protein
VSKTASICVALLASACSEGAAVDGDSPTPTVVEQLANPLAATVTPSVDGQGSVAAIAATVDGEVLPLDLVVIGGSIAARFVAGQLILDHMRVEIADLELPASVIPRDGARLVGLSFELAAGASGSPTFIDDDAVLADMTTAAVIHWTMIKDGIELALADVELAQLALTVAVNLEDDVPVVRISGGQEGPVWSWLDHFGLQDLEFSLIASGADVAE